MCLVLGTEFLSRDVDSSETSQRSMSGGLEIVPLQSSFIHSLNSLILSPCCVDGTLLAGGGSLALVGPCPDGWRSTYGTSQSRARVCMCGPMQAPGGGLQKRWWVLALSSRRIRSRPHGGAGIWVEKWLKELVSFDLKKRKLRASKTADFLKSQKSIPVDRGIGLLCVFLKTSLKLLYLDGLWQPPFDLSEWCTCPPVLPTGLSSLEESCVPWIWAGVLTGPNTAKHLLEELGQRFRN